MVRRDDVEAMELEGRWVRVVKMMRGKEREEELGLKKMHLGPKRLRRT